MFATAEEVVLTIQFLDLYSRIMVSTDEEAAGASSKTSTGVPCVYWSLQPVTRAESNSVAL